MEELFRTFVESIALAVEATGALFIAIGGVEAAVALFARIGRHSRTPALVKKQIFVRFAAWLVMALEFELAADVLRTAIAPTWSDIGQLAAIAVIRTFLNYFLERDIDEYERGPALADAATEA